MIRPRHLALFLLGLSLTAILCGLFIKNNEPKPSPVQDTTTFVVPVVEAPAPDGVVIRQYLCENLTNGQIEVHAFTNPQVEVGDTLRMDVGNIIIRSTVPVGTYLIHTGTPTKGCVK